MRQFALALAVVAAPAWGQTALTLEDAVRLALKQHPAIEASDAGVKAAATKIDQARAGYLPKLNYSESWQRGNNPVFVFSSLLTQHQFSENNFQIGALNRPDAMNNFQSRLAVEQPLYDAGLTRKATRAAQLGRDVAAEQSRRTSMDVIAGVARAYYGAVLASEALKVAEEARKSAEADLARAETIRAAGMTTDADVLSIRVHLAAVREQLIRRSNDVRTSPRRARTTRSALLDSRYTSPRRSKPFRFRPCRSKSTPSAVFSNGPSCARRAWPPRSAKRRPRWLVRPCFPRSSSRPPSRPTASDSWIAAGPIGSVPSACAGTSFNGGEDKARIEEARQQTRQARALARRGESAVRLQVESAYLEWKAAQERIELASATVSAAEESLRITQNRYANGLATVTDLLRTETAYLETRTRRLAAVHDQRVAAAMLELAAGHANAASDVLEIKERK